MKCEALSADCGRSLDKAEECPVHGVLRAESTMQWLIRNEGLPEFRTTQSVVKAKENSANLCALCGKNNLPANALLRRKSHTMLMD